MAPIAGKYEYVSNDNFVGYLVAAGVPADQAEQAIAYVKTVTISVDGNKVAMSGVNKGNFLAVDEEVDEPTLDGGVAKTTTLVSGDTVTLVTKTPDGRVTSRVNQFSDDGMVVTMTAADHSVVGKLIYKRV